jgi:hypothetical protein
VQEANRHAALNGRVSFKEASAKDIQERGFDLVTYFDCLHDMGDPRGCAAHMRRILKDGGTWMIVEPLTGDHPEDNMKPVGRLYYNAPRPRHNPEVGSMCPMLEKLPPESATQTRKRDHHSHQFGRAR